jgi:hypothetical protein
MKRPEQKARQTSMLRNNPGRKTDHNDQAKGSRMVSQQDAKSHYQPQEAGTNSADSRRTWKGSDDYPTVAGMTYSIEAST